MREFLVVMFVTAACGQQVVGVPPLEPPDMNSPYASPRDAARHRLIQTLAELAVRRDVKAAVRGFADALVRDPSYALAAFDLGIAAAAAEKSEDAIAALEDAARLDPALGAIARPQLERLRMITTLEKSPDGQRRRRYDEALLPVLDRLASATQKIPPAEAMYALADLGRIDPRRWEAPALMASLDNDYEVAAKFLAIAVSNAGDPAVKAALQKGLAAAVREVRYASARAAAEAASDSGDHAKAGELFESAWSAVPARATSGFNAAAEFLLENDTARAAGLLTRLRQASDTQLASRATAMLKYLEVIEPAAKAATPQGVFSEDAGSVDPPRLASLLPPIERSTLEMLARRLPGLQPEAEPPVLLVTFSVDPADANAPTSLPALPEPTVTFENTWHDVQAARQRVAVPLAPRTTEAADLAQGASSGQILISSEPSGASIFVDDRTETPCRTPCQLTVETGAHRLRIALSGYREEERAMSIGAANDDLVLPLEVVRGIVTVEVSTGGIVKINGQAIDTTMPADLSLAPGLYRFSAEFGAVRRERELIIRPGAHLRLNLAP